MPYKDLEKQRAWYRARHQRERGDRNAARSARYHAARDELCERRRNERAADPALANLAKAQWIRNNYTKWLDTRRAYVARNRARVNESYRQTYARNRAQILLAKQQRRAVLAGAAGMLSAPEWSDRLLEFGERCAYCLNPAHLGMDHQVPLDRQGPHEIANVVPACRSCNSRKRNKSMFSMLRSDGVDPWYRRHIGGV